jgi:putative ABC transport system substrate-binding protein
MTTSVRQVVAAALLAAATTVLFPAPGAATVIGVVYPECCEAYDIALKGLRTELAAGGYGAGQAEIYEQKPSSDPMSWSNAFRKFVGVDADLIIIFSDEMLEIACKEKTKIPVLFGFVADPAGAKCIKSEESPGRNVTGVSARTPIYTLLAKSQNIQKFSTVGVFDLKGSAISSATLKEIGSHQGEFGYSVVPIPAEKRDEMASALSAAASFDVLFFPNFSVGLEESAAISKTAADKRIPVISLRPSESGSRSLLSLYANPEEQGKLMGRMAVRLLKGESPAKTSVVNPKKIELEVGVGVAKQLGLKIPMSVLQSATKVNR